MRLDNWLTLTKTTQAELARKVGTSAVTIHRIIAGKQNIPLSTADAIARETAGAVTADDLRMTFAETQARIEAESGSAAV